MHTSPPHKRFYPVNARSAGVGATPPVTEKALPQFWKYLYAQCRSHEAPDLLVIKHMVRILRNMWNLGRYCIFLRLPS